MEGGKTMGLFDFLKKNKREIKEIVTKVELDKRNNTNNIKKCNCDGCFN